MIQLEQSTNWSKSKETVPKCQEVGGMKLEQSLGV